MVTAAAQAAVGAHNDKLIHPQALMYTDANREVSELRHQPVCILVFCRSDVFRALCVYQVQITNILVSL